MPSFRSAKKQASHAVSSKIALGMPRHNCKGDGLIHAVRTAQAYLIDLTGYARFLQINRLGDLKSATAENAQMYLAERQEAGLSQKTLDQDRQAIQCHLSKKLDRVQALKKTVLSTRSYTRDQVREISSNQSNRNSLATQITHAAGLRASELNTLRPVSERHASTHRTWNGDRFTGRFGELYTVAGKGGLIREVLIPRDLAVHLEATRIVGGPVPVTDRGVCGEKHYDIGGGKNWSTSFSRVSENRLGWSNGGHGLRHSYAQERMRELQGGGFNYEKALATVAQELGHFSATTTEEYLR
ncbi:MAG: site-specific integrase [Desulfuromonadales bacterium]